jgi:hypothetical protein
LRFTKSLIVISISLLTNNLTYAANVDFISIYSNSSEACGNTQVDKDSGNTKEADASIEASKNKECEHFKINKEFVEPKFSTKRPRGQ